jgi:hypothetical protein
MSLTQGIPRTNFFQMEEELYPFMLDHVEYNILYIL